MYDSESDIKHPLADLGCLEQGRLWAPDRSGSYDDNCARGREYAVEVAELIRREGNPAIFGAVVRAITAARAFEGVEAGFCSYFGIFVMTGDQPVAASTSRFAAMDFVGGRGPIVGD